MTLDLAINATTGDEAVRKAREWAANEPNVERCSVVGAETRDGVSWPDRDVVWTVRVALTFRVEPQLSLELGL